MRLGEELRLELEMIEKAIDLTGECARPNVKGFDGRSALYDC